MFGSRHGELSLHHKSAWNICEGSAKQGKEHLRCAHCFADKREPSITLFCFFKTLSDYTYIVITVIMPMKSTTPTYCPYPPSNLLGMISFVEGPSSSAVVKSLGEHNDDDYGETIDWAYEVEADGDSASVDEDILPILNRAIEICSGIGDTLCDDPPFQATGKGGRHPAADGADADNKQ